MAKRRTGEGAQVEGAARSIPLAPGLLAARPRLLMGLVSALAMGVALSLTPNPLRPVTRALLAWDVGCLVFILAALHGMFECDPEAMKRRAESQDEGAATILALAVVAAVASIAAIAVELSQARSDPGLSGELRVVLAFATVVLSWIFVQLIFGLHYAQVYYAPDPGRPEGVRGGLAFPGGEPPDYWDFLHFALVIGVAAQTADVAFTSKPLRRVGTLHSIVAFGFNTVILALSLNLAAGLFGSV